MVIADYTDEELLDNRSRCKELIEIYKTNPPRYQDCPICDYMHCGRCLWVALTGGTCLDSYPDIVRLRLHATEEWPSQSIERLCGWIELINKEIERRKL